MKARPRNLGIKIIWEFLKWNRTASKMGVGKARTMERAWKPPGRTLETTPGRKVVLTRQRSP